MRTRKTGVHRTQKKWTRITMRLPEDVARQLEEVARAMDRSKAYVARLALRWYLDREMRGIGERKRYEAEEAQRPREERGGA